MILQSESPSGVGSTPGRDIERLVPMPSKSSIIHTCEHCRVDFEVPLYRIRSGHGRFCSKTCKYASVRETPIQRLTKRLDKGTDCWLWTGPVNRNGYGVITFKSLRTVTTHRLAWELFRGEVPEGMCILHHCDVRNCCNPDHLFLGTHADNVADKIAKGRHAYGEKHGRARLGTDQVKKIRARYASGSILQRQLAQEYGVTLSTIGRIIRRKIWTHVE